MMMIVNDTIRCGNCFVKQRVARSGVVVLIGENDCLAHSRLRVRSPPAPLGYTPVPAINKEVLIPLTIRGIRKTPYRLNRNRTPVSQAGNLGSKPGKVSYIYRGLEERNLAAPIRQRRWSESSIRYLYRTLSDKDVRLSLMVKYPQGRKNEVQFLKAKDAGCPLSEYIPRGDPPKLTSSEGLEVSRVGWLEAADQI